MDVTLLGGVGTVTGSRTRVDIGDCRFLVDCGMFQGFKQLRLRNWDLGANATEGIDAVVLTHAHLDHSGLLPRFVRNGFRGPIYCSPATADLLTIVLRDAAYLQEDDARRANRRGYTRHRPARPLFTQADAEAALALVRERPVDVPFPMGDALVTLVPAGHMLGATGVRVEARGKVAFFSGDVGRQEDVLMRPPAAFEGADMLVVESTYGNRLHGSHDPREELGRVVNEVCGRGGVLMIPAFAIGRSQAVMHLLATLRADGRLPDVPVYLNSPMAINASDVFCDHLAAHRLSVAQCHAMCDVATYTRTAEASKELNADRAPKILIAGSGMVTGGRILHHLKAFAGDRKNGVLLVGFQAGGTRGAAIAAEASSVRIHGQDIPIEAQRFRMDGLSGHADWREMVQWLSPAAQPRRILINHGEPTAADAMRHHLREELGWDVEIAEADRTYEL